MTAAYVSSWDGSAIYVTDPTDSLVDEEHIPWTKIEYHIDKAITAPKGPPKSSSQMTAVNESDTPQETTLHLHYSTNTTTGWKHSAGIKLGAKVEVKGGMPMIGASKVELSVEVSYSFEWNQSITTTDAATIDLKVSVPARKAIMGEVTWRESSLIVPFTMRGIGTFASGAKASISFDGVYDGVASWNVRSKWVQVESGERRCAGDVGGDARHAGFLIQRDSAIPASVGRMRSALLLFAGGGLRIAVASVGKKGL